MKRRPRLAVTPTYQGKPCARGHSGLRYRRTNGCIECAKAAARLSNAHRSLDRVEFTNSPLFKQALDAATAARGHLLEAARCLDTVRELTASNPVAMHAPMRELGLTPDLTFRIRKLALASFLDV